VTSDAGHVLLDADLPESVPQIVANVRTLSFRLEDVKLIVNSHVHFDHAGGIAELQRLSGARVVASEWSAAVMKAGGVGTDDPQHGVIRGIAPVSRVETLHDGEAFHVGPLEFTAHVTPGHTPGGTSWSWKSCEANRCLNIVYADSLTAVSADNFRFTDHLQLVRGFERSYAFLRSAPCDILLTTHPDASNLWDRLAARERSAHVGTASPSPDPMIDPAACRNLADNAASQLNKRLAAEKQK
jgi:metallo-beta-lactamase class B